MGKGCLLISCGPVEVDIDKNSADEAMIYKKFYESKNIYTNMIVNRYSLISLYKFLINRIVSFD